MLAVFASAGSTLVGCGNDIKTDRTIEGKDVPIGEPQPVIE